MKDFCLIADPLPYSLRVHPHRNICPDYRLFVQFEADMLRVKDDQEAAPRMASALDRFLGAGWQIEYTTQQAFDQLLWFYRGGQAAPDPSKSAGPGAAARDLWVKCKNPACRREFEIKI